MVRGNFRALNVYIRKEENFKTNHLNYLLKNWEKEEQTQKQQQDGNNKGIKRMKWSWKDD